jgi:hypothetical protein
LSYTRTGASREYVTTRSLIGENPHRRTGGKNAAPVAHHRQVFGGVGGEGWIRTSVSEEPDLQSGAINHSATSPRDGTRNYGGKHVCRQTSIALTQQVPTIVKRRPAFSMSALWNKAWHQKNSFSLNNSNSFNPLFCKAIRKNAVFKKGNVPSFGGSGEIRTHG